MDGNDSVESWDGAVDRMANSLPPEHWDTACQRMADGLATDTPTNWRELATELAQAAELTARNTLALTGRRVPDKRPESTHELALATARVAALAAEGAARRVLELAGSSSAIGTTEGTR